jgi:hypothetical protein
MGRKLIFVDSFNPAEWSDVRATRIELHRRFSFVSGRGSSRCWIRWLIRVGWAAYAALEARKQDSAEECLSALGLMWKRRRSRLSLSKPLHLEGFHSILVRGTLCGPSCAAKGRAAKSEATAPGSTSLGRGLGFSQRGRRWRGIGRRACALLLAFSRSRSGSLFCGGKGHTDSQKARTPDSCGRRRPWTRRPNVLSSFQRTSEGMSRRMRPFRSISRHVSRPPGAPFKLSSSSTRASSEPGRLSSRSTRVFQARRPSPRGRRDSGRALRESRRGLAGSRRGRRDLARA